MGQRKTFRSELRACAVEQHGFVTVHDVRRLGVTGKVLAELLHDGELLRVADDLYRLDGVPRSRWHAVAEGVLRVGLGAFVSHESVLALHELVETEPARIRVSTPRAPRGRWPSHLDVREHKVPAADLTTYRGIHSTTIARALLDCRAILAPDHLAAAADRAVARGLMLRRERHLALDAPLDAPLDVRGV
jgi:predicted transcriptional regulator of viral defense system